MKHAFVIPCYFDPSRPVIFDCVASIRLYHPDSEIIVIDSGSKDKSYFQELAKFNVVIKDINNQYYDTGAYWYAYKNFPEYDFFYFLHDSIVLNKSILHLLNYPVTSVGYFMSHDGLGAVYLQQKLSSILKKYLKFKLGITRLRNDAVGFDSAESKNWAAQQLSRTKYFIPKVFISLFGPMMAVNRFVLDKLDGSGLSSILPTNKSQQMTMERIFGIALGLEGYDITENALLGNTYSEKVQREFLVKIYLNRK
jgi:glycosyltransferase involved in cell wall biosynthesis